jgi:dsRNA-specific ribonuclease
LDLNLKRPRTPAAPLPDIGSELSLEVFIHSSIKPKGQQQQNEEFGDSSRLAELGAQVLQMIATWSLFCKRPMLTADEIAEERSQVLGDANIDSWLTMYRMREKVRCDHDVVNLKTPEVGRYSIFDFATSHRRLFGKKNLQEGRKLFNSYVGAVYLQDGMAACQKWISRLIDPDWEVPALPESEGEAKRPRIEPPNLLQPAAPAPPLPGLPLSIGSSISHTPPPYQATISSTSAAAPGMAFLPVFNQVANQRRVQVDYPANFSGPPHAGRWSVKCVGKLTNNPFSGLSTYKRGSSGRGHQGRRCCHF